MAQVEYILNERGGRMTRLMLGPIEGYTPDPGQVKVHKHAGHKGGHMLDLSGLAPGLMSLARLGQALRSMVTRAIVQQSGVGPRIVVQVAGLDNEVFAVELLHPAGVSARPRRGADVVLLQVCGARDHVVAIGGDNVGDAVPDLAEGEVGISAFGSRVVFRTNKLEVTATTHPVLVTAGNGLTANVTGAAIVAATTIQLNAPGDEVRVNGRKVQLI